MVNRIVFGLAGLAAIGVAVASAHASAGNIGPSRASAADTAYYDDHYGPFYNGYWTVAGEYYFTTGAGRPYMRDDGHHFRHVLAAGFRPVEGFAGAMPSQGSASR